MQLQSYLIIMAVLDIASLGLWATLTVGFAIFIGRYFAEIIADKLKIKWSREQEEKLERLRAEITHEHSVFTAILNSHSSSHQFSQSDRIEAVKILWDNMLKLKNDYLSFPGLFFDSLSENEYNQNYNNKTIMSGLNSLSTHGLFDKTLSSYNIVEKYRPFLGEQLWSLFHIYNILVIRVVFKLIEGRDEKNIVSWNKDKYIQLILDKAFTEEEKKSIPSPQKIKPTIDLMEQKILFEIAKITSGELAAESEWSKAKKYQELVKQIEIPDKMANDLNYNSIIKSLNHNPAPE